MSEKLLPCPFCGSDQLVVKPNAFDGLLRVQCEGCWATSVTSNQKKVAVAAWNTRVGVAPTPGSGLMAVVEAFAESSQSEATSRLRQMAKDALAKFNATATAPPALVNPIEQCIAICLEEAKEWDSDSVQTLKNYAGHCANRIDEEVKRSTASTVEPVAWQRMAYCWGEPTGEWINSGPPEKNVDGAKYTYIYRPLYAAPPSPDTVRESLALKALKQHVNYESLPTDRGGSHGSKGRACKAFVEMRDAALSSAPVDGEWQEALAKGFMTACSGDGEYQIKIGFETLKDMQAAHMALCKSAYAQSRNDRLPPVSE